MTSKSEDHHRMPKPVADLRRAMDLGGVDEHAETEVLDAVKARLLATQHPTPPGIPTTHREMADTFVSSSSGTVFYYTKARGVVFISNEEVSRPRRDWGRIALISVASLGAAGPAVAWALGTIPLWPLLTVAATAAAIYIPRLMLLFLLMNQRSMRMMPVVVRLFPFHVHRDASEATTATGLEERTGSDE